MSGRTRGAVVFVAFAALTLTGCSASSSTLTITYEDRGSHETVTMHTDSVVCGDRSVSGVARSVAPAGLFSIRMSGKPGEARASVSATVRKSDGTRDLLVFESDQTAPVANTPQSVTLAQTPGTVTLVENWDGNQDFDRSDGTELAGTLAADLRCD